MGVVDHDHDRAGAGRVGDEFVDELCENPRHVAVVHVECVERAQRLTGARSLDGAYDEIDDAPEPRRGGGVIPIQHQGSDRRSSHARTRVVLPAPGGPHTNVHDAPVDGPSRASSFGRGTVCVTRGAKNVVCAVVSRCESGGVPGTVVTVHEASFVQQASPVVLRHVDVDDL